ncbi:hypothetical protein GGTG_00807 [Gaeumannomyces tritici R3-111a-1]|uniref:Uncharacterized protein n=1 Tax=Gaeumannomyces tritici (strain R3-111a-1) TaxID=644352 RepID=J3NHS0_GAET3|nr:hypothetical protein GGTG_00807 [Gaeumannomyces tritici R3-111a-1]EJT80813.1 hypothetical protein GGTG_00807 [Gaeumannomyces tritici R3-111a-1]
MGLPKLRLRVARPPGADEVRGRDALLDNEDLRPLRLADRTWGFWTYCTFWFSAVATVTNWYGAAAGQALGLGMWESLACATGGQLLIAVVMALNGRPGATYHVGFPAVNRAAFGVFGALWPTLNRALMATVRNGVNMVQGGHAGMIGLAVFFVVTCGFLLVPVPKMRGLVYAKLAVFAVSATAMLAWTVTKAGGLGPVNCATFANNAADFQRYAKRPSDVILGNVVGFPLSNFLVGLVGDLVCASSQPIFGELVWNPVTLLDRIQTADYTPANRAGCFLIALCFAYSAMFSSIFENSLPAGNDIAALLPRYLTVRRGFFVCATASLALNPWYLLGSAAVFVSFMASYQIFLSAITGVLLVHYYVVARGRLDIPACFTADRDGPYYYRHGWN